MEFSQTELAGKVLLAMLLGGIIGIERELKRRPAGFRTHMLVCGAGALLVGLGDVVIAHFADRGVNITADPIRIFEAIFVGVSFLGTGTIIQGRGEAGVQGLTTAASLLFSAAIGISVALDQYGLALGLTAIVVCTLFLLGLVEQKLLEPRAKSSR